MKSNRTLPTAKATPPAIDASTRAAGARLRYTHKRNTTVVRRTTGQTPSELIANMPIRISGGPCKSGLAQVDVKVVASTDVRSASQRFVDGARSPAIPGSGSRNAD